MFDIETEWVARNEYAFHLGGRHELQYNIGYEIVGGTTLFRHGVAFSLQRSQWVLDVVEVLLPKIVRFNEFITLYPHIYAHFAMWYWNEEGPSSEFPVTAITSELAAPETFIMIGRRSASPPIDLDAVLRDFDELLPLYEYVESSDTTAFPSLSNVIRFLVYTSFPGTALRLAGRRVRARRSAPSISNFDTMRSKPSSTIS